MTDLRADAASQSAHLAELRKLSAFVRRDFLMALSYRWGFLSDAVGMVAQTLVFYFVSQMVIPGRIPEYGGTRTTYFAFVTVGIALNAVLQVLMSRMALAVRSEQLMGTLESLLMTPTSAMTLQLGSVMYDLLYVPIRTAAFLGLVAVLFGVNFSASGWAPAALILGVFIPFVWGLGAASAAAVLTYRQVPGLLGIGVAALSLASGAFFPLDLFPDWIVSVARFNPIAMALHGMRAALLGGTEWTEVWPTVAVLAPASALTLTAGSLVFQIALRRERRLGTLGLY